MKTSALLLGAVAAIAAAQSVEDLVSQIPECILPCIQEGAAAAGCTEGDRQCECENADTITASVSTCVLGSSECEDPVSSLTEAAAVSAQICELVLSEGGDDSDAEETTATGEDAPEETTTETATETTTEEPEATETSEDGEENEDEDEDTEETPTSTDEEASPTETPGAAGKAGVAWAGVAAAVAAMAL